MFANSIQHKSVSKTLHSRDNKNYTNNGYLTCLSSETLKRFNFESDKRRGNFFKFKTFHVFISKCYIYSVTNGKKYIYIYIDPVKFGILQITFTISGTPIF